MFSLVGVFIFLAVLNLAASESHHTVTNRTFDLYDQGFSARQSLASVRRIGREDWSQWTANDHWDRHFLLPCLRLINGTINADGDILMVDKSIEPKVGKVGDRCDQLRDDGEKIVRSRCLIDTDRRQSELPWFEGRWLWRVDYLGIDHECDPSIVKFSKVSLKMRHLLLRQQSFKASRCLN